MRSDPNADLRALVDDWAPAPIPMGPVGSHPAAGSPPPEAEQQSRAGAAGGTATGQRPALDGCVSAGHQPSPTTTPDPAEDDAPRRGDVVSWLHHTRVQVGVVQNLAADGRLWVRRLDFLDQRLPLDPTDVLIHYTARELHTEAAYHWSDAE